VGARLAVGTKNPEYVRENKPLTLLLRVQYLLAMPHPSAAPVEADALRPLAQAITHAHFPAALKLLLLALLAAFSMATGAGRALRRPGRDWYLSSHADSAANPDSAQDPHILRAIRRLRAWLGWILRCDRAEGMALSGQRAQAPCPTRTARAPPWRVTTQIHPESATKTPPLAAPTHA
jgi:hypothetical protein